MLRRAVYVYVRGMIHITFNNSNKNIEDMVCFTDVVYYNNNRNTVNSKGS
jgi:hypothetical protein